MICVVILSIKLDNFFKLILEKLIFLLIISDAASLIELESVKFVLPSIDLDNILIAFTIVFFKLIVLNLF